MSERYDRLRRIRREKRRQRRQQRSLKKTMKSALGWFISILTAAILGYGFVAFGFQTVYMVGPSMEPTLTDGESYLVNKAVYLVTSPERYDVVAYRIVENQDKYYSIKRVVYINGNPLADYPVDCEIKTAGIAESAITLGENEYFLLGDNPDNSQDSRFQAAGNVQKSEMLGRVKIK